MKTEGQIRQQIKQVIYRHRKTYIRTNLSRHPENCAFNERVHLPVHMANRATLRVCGYCPNGEDRNNVVCDATMGGEAQAGNCGFFEPRVDAEMLKEEFNHKLGIDGGPPKEIGYIAKHYPDLAALLWVMGPGKGTNSEAPPAEDKANILAFFGDGDSEDMDVPERPFVEETDES